MASPSARSHGTLQAFVEAVVTYFLRAATQATGERRPSARSFHAPLSSYHVNSVDCIPAVVTEWKSPSAQPSLELVGCHGGGGDRVSLRTNGTMSYVSVADMRRQLERADGGRPGRR
ncbi:hypothetical protein NFJ02_11g07490 [Pycnococcus provasolii]